MATYSIEEIYQVALGAGFTPSQATTWTAIALAESGKLNEARLTFEKMLTYASPLGLYSEEIALTGEQIGNFPQAFSHLSLISAAIELDRALNQVSGAASISPATAG